MRYDDVQLRLAFYIPDEIGRTLCIFSLIDAFYRFMRRHEDFGGKALRRMDRSYPAASTPPSRCGIQRGSPWKLARPEAASFCKSWPSIVSTYARAGFEDASSHLRTRVRSSEAAHIRCPKPCSASTSVYALAFTKAVMASLAYCAVPSPNLSIFALKRGSAAYPLPICPNTSIEQSNE